VRRGWHRTLGLGVEGARDRIRESQSTLRGDYVTDPLRVVVHDAQGQPVSDVSVRWTVTAGEATLEQATSTTNTSGEADTRVTLVKTLGEVVVTASVTGASAVDFHIASLEPCDARNSWVITLGHGVTGELNPYDCELQSDNRYWDFYFFTLTSQQAVTVRTQASGFDTKAWLFSFDDGNARGTKIDSVATLNAAVVKAILAPGNYFAGVSSYAATVGAYDVLVSPASSSAASCDEELWIVRGVTTPQDLAATDCHDDAGEHYEDRYSMILWEGEHLHVTQSSTDFAPVLRLARRSGEVVATADGTATGVATIDFTGDVHRGEYILTASSAQPQRTGAYTLALAGASQSAQDISVLPKATSTVRASDFGPLPRP
jgi:hypothetical protein